MHILIPFCTGPLEVSVFRHGLLENNVISRVSCQKGPTRHAYAWQIGPFGQDTHDIQMSYNAELDVITHLAEVKKAETVRGGINEQ